MNALWELCLPRAVSVLLYSAEQKECVPSLSSILSLVVLKGLQSQLKTNVLTFRK